jgi:hypothetical protein
MTIEQARRLLDEFVERTDRATVIAFLEWLLGRDVATVPTSRRRGYREKPPFTMRTRIDCQRKRSR